MKKQKPIFSGDPGDRKPVALCLETATRVCSVALLRGEMPLFDLSFTPPSGHSASLMPAVEGAALMSGHESSTWEAVVISSGPGSFTGLRIGMAAAKALSLGLGIPLYGVSTLEALACRIDAEPGTMICPVVDARKRQLFCALYRKGTAGLEIMIEPAAVYPEDLPRLIPPEALFTGDGICRYRKEMEEAYGPGLLLAPPDKWSPSAVAVGRLALPRILSDQPSEMIGLVPQYVRASDAELSYAGKKKVRHRD